MANSTSGDSVIDRVVRVLSTFSNTRTAQTPSDIGRRAGLPVSTAHRLVTDLVASGLLERDEDGRVRLGMRLWELAMRGSWALRLRQAALPHIDHVTDVVRQSTQLAVIENEDALFLERMSAPSAGRNLAHVAGRLPLHTSSAGLVLLAHAPADLQERVLAGPLPAATEHSVTDRAALRRMLSEIRRTGRIVAHGFVDSDATAIAVPVRSPRGEVIAALAVVMPRGTHPDEFVLTHLRRASDGIRASLGETLV